MKHSLKVGDRVRLTGFSHNGSDVDGARGTVMELPGKFLHDRVLVRVDGAPTPGYQVSPSQCKRLVKKKRETIWLNHSKNLTSYTWYSTEASAQTEAMLGRTHVSEWRLVRRIKV